MSDKFKEETCYLCRSETFSLYKFESSGIVKCGECGLLRSFPVPLREDIKSLYGRKLKYDAKKSSEVFNSYLLESLKSRFIITPLLKKLKNILKKKDNPGLLDVGCSTGWITSIARDCGFDVKGLEANIHSAKIGRDKYKLDIIEGFLEDVEISQKFEAVTMFHVLEHLVDPLAELNRIYELLNEDGKFLVVVPNGESLGTKLFRQHYNWNLRQHVSFFSKKSLAVLLQNAGFKVLSIKTLPSTPLLRNSFNRWMRYRKAKGGVSFKLKNDILSNFLMLPLAMTGKALGKGEVLVVYAERS